MECWYFMKKESWKFLIMGLVVLVIIIFIKDLILPNGFISFFTTLIAALIIGLYLSKKIKSIEK